jgi:hypothetical protein
MQSVKNRAPYRNRREEANEHMRAMITIWFAAFLAFLLFISRL